MACSVRIVAMPSNVNLRTAHVVAINRIATHESKISGDLPSAKIQNGQISLDASLAWE